MSPARALLTGGGTSPHAGHLLAVLSLSAAWEMLFFSHGMSLVDEGWPLYAALQLQHGRALYDEIFWVFPPGHLLAAWVGLALDPPGILLARVVYSLFSISLVGTLYVLGCRLMPERFALLAAAVVAVAAPRSHLAHIVFGYRYLVFSVLALLLFARWLRTDRIGSLFGAGLVTGLGATFRLSPAFAVACGIGVGILAAGESFRGRWRSLGGYAVGVALPMGAALLWLGSEVGLEALWRELVVRPGRMVELQSVPWPGLGIAEWSRDGISQAFMAFEFRGGLLLCGLFVAGLVGFWVRASLRGDRFAYPLQLAVAVWASVFFLRTVHRSDEFHLDSALPPICLLFVLFAHGVFERFVAPRARSRAAAAEWAAVAVLGATWVFLSGADLWLSKERRGLHPLASTGGVVRIADPELAKVWDGLVAGLKRLPPDARVLDLTVSPMLYVLSGRLGPGEFDVVMPGTFLDDEEEEGFVERLERSPPAGLIAPHRLDQASRSEKSAPILWRWMRAHYGDSRIKDPP
jgi:hypothetical protein